MEVDLKFLSSIFTDTSGDIHTLFIVQYILIFYYFIRRLTVVYAFILGFIATLLVFIGIGPNWQIVRDMKESCKDNWWTNLLYINNYKGVRPNPKYVIDGYFFTQKIVY